MQSKPLGKEEKTKCQEQAELPAKRSGQNCLQNTVNYSQEGVVWPHVAPSLRHLSNVRPVLSEVRDEKPEPIASQGGYTVYY